jgi:hypothetical protein
MLTKLPAAILISVKRTNIFLFVTKLVTASTSGLEIEWYDQRILFLRIRPVGGHTR